jgi:hypothetical protein
MLAEEFPEVLRVVVCLAIALLFAMGSCLELDAIQQRDVRGAGFGL